jgi:hypothetical protein
MKFSGDYLYRVVVTSYPSGAFTCVHEELDLWEPTPGWQPPGWRPVGNYTQIMGTHEFVWPVTNKVYGSQSTAKKRADLLQSFGATAVVERSSRITWPDMNEEIAA